MTTEFRGVRGSRELIVPRFRCLQAAAQTTALSRGVRRVRKSRGTTPLAGRPANRVESRRWLFERRTSDSGDGTLFFPKSVFRSLRRSITVSVRRSVAYTHTQTQHTRHRNTVDDDDDGARTPTAHPRSRPLVTLR